MPTRFAPSIAAALLAACLLLPACASRTTRVEQALVRSGVSPKLAACLAPRLTGRLSDDQLRTLAAAAKARGGRGAGAIVAAVAGTGDPAIVDAASAAALHCALR